MQCFSCCGGKSDVIGADHVLQPLNLYNPRAQTSVEQLIGQSEDARLRLYSKLGSLQDFILTQAAPVNIGAPRWPTASQKFRVINRPNGTALIVSDGLSDPFDDLQMESNINGYGLEFFIETPATEVGPDPSELKSSWQFQLLYTVCSLAAGHGGIRSIIDDMQLLSTEAEGVGDAIPQDYKTAVVNRAGRVGALLGLTETDPGSPSCKFSPQKRTLRENEGKKKTYTTKKITKNQKLKKILRCCCRCSRKD